MDGNTAAKVMKPEFKVWKWPNYDKNRYDYYAYCTEKQSTKEEAEAVAAPLSALAEKVAGLEAENERLRRAALDAAQDIAEWQQLARYQRENSIDYSHDPLCATDAALETSERRKNAVYQAAATLLAGDGGDIHQQPKGDANGG